MLNSVFCLFVFQPELLYTMGSQKIRLSKKSFPINPLGLKLPQTVIDSEKQ